MQGNSHKCEAMLDSRARPCFNPCPLCQIKDLSSGDCNMETRSGDKCQPIPQLCAHELNHRVVNLNCLQFYPGTQKVEAGGLPDLEDSGGLQRKLFSFICQVYFSEAVRKAMFTKGFAKSQVWQHTAIILALRKQKHTNLCEFKACLVYMENSWSGKGMNEFGKINIFVTENRGESTIIPFQHILFVQSNC